MSVTAKVKCATVEPAGSEQTRVTFTPDYQDGRNAEWAAATPSLVLDMVVRNEVAEANFVQGKPYTLTFTTEENSDDHAAADGPARLPADDGAPFPATGDALGPDDVSHD